MGWHPILRRAGAVLAAAALLAGCGNTARDQETAARAMDGFHQRFNAGEYGKIYDTADPEFQDRNVRGDFLRQLEEIHHKLGDYRTCDNRGRETSLFSADTRVTLRYRTTFAAGEADEEFVYAIVGTRAALYSYHIDPGVLTVR